MKKLLARLGLAALAAVLGSCTWGADYSPDVVGQVQSWAPIQIVRPQGLMGPSMTVPVPQSRKTMLHD